MGSNRKYIVQINGKTIECLSKFEICQKYELNREQFHELLDKGQAYKGHMTIDIKLDGVDYSDLMETDNV